MENIFKNAYFGKAYKMRDGRKAIYIYYGADSIFPFIDRHHIIIEGTPHITTSQSDSGEVVSEWSEEIDEEELGKIAIEESKNLPLLDTKVGKAVAYSRGYKDGYRKALASS